MTRRPHLLLTALITLAACESDDKALNADQDGLLRPAVDFAAPTVRGLAVTGATRLNDGRTVVTQRDLVLTANATDSSGVTSVCVSMDSKSCVVWQDWDGSALAELSPGEGEKALYLWFRDGAGNVSRRPHTLRLTLDRFAPDDGQLEVANGPGSVQLDWWGFNDGGVGIDGYIVVQDAGSAPSSCEEGTVVYSGPATTLELTDLATGHPYGWRICAVDLLGQTSRGVIGVAESLTELDAPIVTTFSTADGETSLHNRAVTLRVEAADANGIAAMCLSEGPTCDEWTAFTPDPRFVLADEDGAHTISLWLQDGIGNRSRTPSRLDLWLDRAVDMDGDGSPAGVDCDDEDAAKRPGLDELCNGFDDNCDGLIDDADPALAIGAGLRAFRDLDFDGFGDPGQPVEVCALQPGLSLSNGDCDDSAAGSFPGAPDSCDGEDNDCDGDIDEERALLDGAHHPFGAARQQSDGLHINGTDELSGVIIDAGPAEANSTLRFELVHGDGGVVGVRWSAAAYADPEGLLEGRGKGLRALFSMTGAELLSEDTFATSDWSAPLPPGSRQLVELIHHEGLVDVVVDGVPVSTDIPTDIGDTVVFAVQDEAVVISPPTWTCEG